MKLLSFSITNFRSITSMHKIPIDNLTVLLGKNNEGKSNILNALNIAMNAMLYNSKENISEHPGFFSILIKRIGYDWNRDFPVQLQHRKNGLESVFSLVFRLEGEELDTFHKEIKIRGNEDIPIRISLGQRTFKIEVPKRGTSSYNKNSRKITSFISKRISFNYIRAIRTEEMALQSLLDVISEELRRLNEDADYQKLQHEIYGMQQKVLDKISKNLEGPLKVFLPNIRNVQITRNTNDLDFEDSLFRDLDIIVDDGIPTSIKYKGDGIKSLAALAILKDRQTTNGASIIAIEEPECHLHSGAIHELCDVINEISTKNQVILTTHNPLFVQRNFIKSNIVVEGGKAAQARGIKEIRDVLGVMPEDNLRNANKVIVVEGEDDLICIRKILSLKNILIREALQNNSLIITALRGASNLSHKLFDLKETICDYVVLLDNDAEGIKAFEDAQKYGLINDSKVRFTICNGCKESELEDCLQTDIYENYIFSKYSVNLKCKEFHSNYKWSDRLKSAFQSQGAFWGNDIEKQIKENIAKSLPDDLSKILITQKSGFLNGFETIVLSLIGSDGASV